jgi:hypothetical protein
MEVGLKITDYGFADYLKNIKKLSPQETKSNLCELREEYSDTIWQ